MIARERYGFGCTIFLPSLILLGSRSVWVLSDWDRSNKRVPLSTITHNTVYTELYRHWGER